MKPVIIIIFLLSVACLSAKTQIVALQKLKDNSCFVSPGTIKFADEKIVLNNATLKCDKLLLSSKVQTIEVEGQVNITCTDFEIESNSTKNVSITGSGMLNIQYSAHYTDNNQSLSPKSSEKVGISIIKQ